MFYKSCKVHIIQCDDRIRKDDVISNQNEMDQLLNSFTLVGKGNTDFRPVFSYVNDLINQKVFQNLCGLLYFTDGKGIYPKKSPAYKTAFVVFALYSSTSFPDAIKDTHAVAIFLPSTLLYSYSVPITATSLPLLRSFV